MNQNSYTEALRATYLLQRNEKEAIKSSNDKEANHTYGNSQIVADHKATICMEDVAFDDTMSTDETFLDCRWWIKFCVKILLLISEGNETTKKMGEREGGYLVAVVSVWAVEELNPRVWASELAAARNPGDGGTLVEKIDRLEEWHALLHDHAHPQDLSFIVIGDELRWQHLDNGIGVLLLGVCR